MAADSFRDVKDAYAAHGASLRGSIRHELVARQLVPHLPPAPARIADVGGGGGEQALRLARAGYEVAILDRSASMLAEARDRVSAEAASIAGRVSYCLGVGEQAVALLGASTFDAVLCHGVLPYVEDPAPLMAACVGLVRPRGVVSVLAKNGLALAMRPGLEGRYDDAIAAFTLRRDLGRLGLVTWGNSIDELVRLLGEHGAELVHWYGVRVFTDHLGDAPPGEDWHRAVEAELLAGEREPYRRVARLLHAVARRVETAGP